MSDKNKLDDIDYKILSILTNNAQLPYTEVANRVFVSGGTVHVRMKKMEKMGIIRGSQLNIDYSKLGFDIKAFLGIYLKESALYDEVVEQLSKIHEIISIDYTTGTYSMFCKIICRDTNHLREVLHDKIQKVSGIDRTETIISLDETISRNVKLDANPK